MKRNTLFEHKESAITCEKTMENVEEYLKLLEPMKKLEKTPNNTLIENICNFWHKPRHLEECCHWNPKNPHNKLKGKKEVLINKVSPQARKGMNRNHEKQRN
jgi:hypothetical protein